MHDSELLVESPVHVLLGAYLPAGQVQSVHWVVSNDVVPLHLLAMYCPLLQPAGAQSAQTMSDAVIPEQGTRMYWPAFAEEQLVLQSVHCPS